MIDAGSEETVGPYILHREIARGGMATIHVARLVGDEGFSRIVAAKRMLPELAADAEFVSMFIDEAKIASKVHHRNVVPVLDVVTSGGEVILVQEYVHGVPLNTLLKTAAVTNARIPVDVAVSIASQILTGLHAAHETVGPRGKPLDIVHRDVSPGNIIVGVDGTARLLDFGVAKAAFAAHITRVGTFKGKRTYSAPEALQGQATRQSDVYSLSIVLWELVTGKKLHSKHDPEAEMLAKIMQGRLPTLMEALADEREHIDDGRWLQLRAVEPIIMKGLARDVARRWQSAAEMEKALVSAVRPASASDVAAWAKRTGKDFLEGREQLLATEEAGWRSRPLERRRTGTPKEVEQIAPEEPAQPPVRNRRIDPRIAILCGLVIVLGIVLAFVAHRRGATAATTAAMPARPWITLPTMKKATVEPPKSEVRSPKSEVPPAEPTKSAPRPELRPRTPPPPPVPSSPAPSRRAAPNNCNPPYYFKGSKKIFKPACL